MPKNLEVVFDYNRDDEAKYIETVKEHGAVILRSFWYTVETDMLRKQVMAGRFKLIDKFHPTSGVHEQYGLQQWDDIDSAPDRVQDLTAKVGEMVRSQGIPWNPNQVRAQLYGNDKAGMKFHVDPPSAEMLVSIFNAAGTAPFSVMAGRHQVTVPLQSGDLVILNNTKVPGMDNRVKHQVGAGNRLSVTMREEHNTVNVLERAD